MTATFSAAVVRRHIDRTEVELFDRSDISQGVLEVTTMEAWYAVVASLEVAGEVLAVEKTTCPRFDVYESLNPMQRGKVEWWTPCCRPPTSGQWT